MSQAMPPQTEIGYAPPTVRQFSVFLDNRVGKLLELVQLFDDDPHLHVAAFSVLDSSDHAVVRLIINNADAARSILRRKQYTFSEHDLLVVEVDGEQSLTRMCLYLLNVELNIDFAYPVMVRKDDGGAMIALAVDDPTLGGQILRRKGFRLMGEEDRN